MTKNEIKAQVMTPVLLKGHKIYFVGGCVRDKMLHFEPHDYDLVTDATPDQLHEIFDKFSNVSENAEQFGVTMPIVMGEEVEIATMRRDMTKGRHPKIEFTNSIDEDAQRRDFTINALYEDIDGNVIDPTEQGVDDIDHNTLRFIGDFKDRIEEDPLRIFRALRFISKFGFKFAHDADDFCSKSFALINAGRFAEVSKERMLKELEGILGGRHFDLVKDLFVKSGVESVIGLSAIMNDLATCPQSFKWHAEGALVETEKGTLLIEDEVDVETMRQDGFIKVIQQGTVFDHTERVVQKMFEIIKDIPDTHTRFLLMLSAYLHDIGKPISARKNGIKPGCDVPDVHDHDETGAQPAFEFCRHLSMSNADSDFVKQMVRFHMRMHNLPDCKKLFSILKITSLPIFPMLILLAKADERGCIKTEADEWGGIEIALKADLVAEAIAIGKMPAPLVTGDDLIAAGMTPGPDFAYRLEVAHALQVNKHELRKEVLLKQAIHACIPVKKQK